MNSVNIVGRCRKAMWSGLGLPAGLCGEPAYGDCHPWARYSGSPSCPLHGGPSADGHFRLAYDRIAEDKRVRFRTLSDGTLPAVCRHGDEKCRFGDCLPQDYVGGDPDFFVCRDCGRGVLPGQPHTDAQ